MSPRPHRIVDAMNVIGSRPDGWWRDRPGAIARLVSALDVWADGREERMTVVLEHRPAEPLKTERVEVVWAEGGPNAADDEIVRRLPGWLGETDEVTVVTSDRDLADRARAAGAAVEGAAGFRRALDF